MSTNKQIRRALRKNKEEMLSVRIGAVH